MYMVSAALDAPLAQPTPAGLAYGMPVGFKGKSGFFHPAGGAIGIVLCSPWGYEELSMRKSWRLLAETLAQAGYPTLRFDYPGTGNSLDGPAEAQSCDAWIESIHHAVDFLRFMSGVRKFVLVGQSLGAALAVAAANARRDILGLRLIAPVSRGASYVRELSATAALVTQRIGIAHQPSEDEALSVVGFPLSRAMVDGLKALNVATCDRLGSLDVAIFDRNDRKASAELLEHVRATGARVHWHAIEPYHLMISDATVIQPLPVAPEKIVRSLSATFPVSAVRVHYPAHGASLTAATFREEPIRFGRDGALFGILCHPVRPRSDAPAFVLLNRGLNPHVGWRRVSVDHARALAASGITSLRIDVAGVGESRDEPGRPANLIYSDLLLPDIRAAVDVVAARGHKRIALSGVCSGAYMAFAAACGDARVTDVVAFNPQRLIWDPTENPEDVIRYGLRSVNDYVGDIRGGDAWGKAWRSRKRIVPALRFLLKRQLNRVAMRAPAAWHPSGSMAARVEAALRTLANNGTRVSLVFTPGDPGLDELSRCFGTRHLRRANVTVSMIPDADHNLTATSAVNAMLNYLLAGGSPLPIDPPEEGPSATPQPHARPMACPG